MVALVGPSGARQTTITHLVARLDVGAVPCARRRDRRPRRDPAVPGGRGRLRHPGRAHVPRTIRGNLLYARPGASDQEVWQALEAAQIAPLVRTLPDGLDTVVGDRGYRLSGGERQRLAIARLLLKAPRSWSSTGHRPPRQRVREAAVQRALDAALTGRTSLVIAHLLSTIREADQILVVDGGRSAAWHPTSTCSPEGGPRRPYRTQFQDTGRAGSRTPV